MRLEHLGLLLLLLCACGESRHEDTRPNPVAGASGSAGSAVTATGGVGGASLGGTAGVSPGSAGGGTAGLAGAAAGSGPVMLPPLAIRAPSQLATCDPTQCQVVSDWDALEMGAGEFVDFHVAAASDVTYVTMEASYGAGAYHRRIVALDANGSRDIPQGRIGSMSPLLLAVDASGAPHVVGIDTDTTEAVLTDSTWQSSSIEDDSDANGFEIGADDKPTVFYSGIAGLMLAVRQDGSWSKTVLPQTGLGGGFTLDGDAAPLFWSDDMTRDASGAINGGLLEVVDATGATLASEPLSYGNAYLMPADALPQATPSSNNDAAMFELPDGLHLVLADRTANRMADTLVPNTVPPTSPCPAYPVATSTSVVAGAECAPSCLFSGMGLESGPLFAVARTADGTFWLAYATSVFSIEFDYTWQCGPTGCSNCLFNPGVGQSVSTLHILSSTPDATAFSEAVSVELEGLIVPGQDNAWGIRARGFGQRVAVAVSERTADDELGVRVITLEAPSQQ